MVRLLCALVLLLAVIVVLLILKIASMHKAMDEIRTAFAERLMADTNVGIDLSTSDRRMRRLTADIDAQLKNLRRQYIRYAQGDHELKEAVTNIAHDLRTPLTAIRGYMELLEREDLPEPTQRYLAIIGNRVDALTQLTQELFRYSVIVSSGPLKDIEPTALGEALEDCLASHYGALTERGISPTVTIPKQPVVCLANKTALSRILSNIAGNAVKYSDGDLTVELSTEGAITFRNHASQLDEVSVGRLFDRFYTVESGQGGTGLGLSIAKILTEQMGGTITAAIENDLFTIRLNLPPA